METRNFIITNYYADDSNQLTVNIESKTGLTESVCLTLTNFGWMLQNKNVRLSHGEQTELVALCNKLRWTENLPVQYQNGINKMRNGIGQYLKHRVKKAGINAGNKVRHTLARPFVAAGSSIGKQTDVPVFEEKNEKNGVRRNTGNYYNRSKRNGVKNPSKQLTQLQYYIKEQITKRYDYIDRIDAVNEFKEFYKVLDIVTAYNDIDWDSVEGESMRNPNLLYKIAAQIYVPFNESMLTHLKSIARQFTVGDVVNVHWKNNVFHWQKTSDESWKKLRDRKIDADGNTNLYVNRNSIKRLLIKR